MAKEKYLYNDEIKNQYFESLPNNKSKESIIRFFKRVGTYMESYMRKDLYEMTESEIKESYVELGVIDYTQIRSELSHLRKYLEWTQSSGIAKPTGISIAQTGVYDIDIKKPLRKNLFKDMDVMIEKIKVVYPESEWDNCYAMPSAICLSWLGFTIKEMLLLTNNDIDIKNKRVIFNGKIRAKDIDDRILNILNKYKSNLTGQRKSGKGYSDIYLKDIGFFFKREIKGQDINEGKPLSVIMFNQAFSRFLKNYKAIMGEDDVNYSFKNENIILSANLNKLYHAERDGTEITNDVIIEYLGLTFNNNSKLIMTEIEDERKRYESYKEVFWK